MGFSGGSAVKNLPAMQETQEIKVQFQGWEDPLEEGMATHRRTFILPLLYGLSVQFSSVAQSYPTLCNLMD